jgi:hypothetical protein
VGLGSQDKPPSPKRRYSPLYERLVPLALGIIVLLVIILLLIIVGVALGLFPGVG